MARADLLLELVRAGARGEQLLFRKALEALIAEERAKQHHILADRLTGHLNQSEPSKPVSTPTYRNGLTTNLFYELNPTRRMDDLILSDIITAVCKELIGERMRAALQSCGRTIACAPSSPGVLPAHGRLGVGGAVTCV
jgi:hypothetical protein